MAIWGGSAWEEAAEQAGDRRCPVGVHGVEGRRDVADVEDSLVSSGHGA